MAKSAQFLFTRNFVAKIDDCMIVGRTPCNKQTKNKKNPEKQHTELFEPNLVFLSGFISMG